MYDLAVPALDTAKFARRNVCRRARDAPAAARPHHQERKDPRLLSLLGKQRYRSVNRFQKHTAAVRPEDRAHAVRRACDLAIKQGLFAAYRETRAEFSITM
jgi:hypothetical protein